MRPPIKEQMYTSEEAFLSWLHELWQYIELCSCKIQTVTYTGDGSESLDVTTNFDPKYVRIWPDLGSSEGDIEVFEALDITTTGYAWSHNVTATHEHYQVDNRLVALGTLKFTVDDDSADSHPNKDGQTYRALVLG